MRLIDAERLRALIVAMYEPFPNICNVNVVLTAIDNAPTIEAEPVRHGRWENIPGMNNTVFCSECLAAANKELAMKYKGCPFCLARMDGGGENG